MEFGIRQASARDAAALSMLGAATFLETYHALIPGADILAFCATRHTVARYAAWANDPACELWIAEAPLGAPIGYLVLTPATLPLEEPSPGDLEVLRIYVLHPFHKAGVGHRLMQHAVEAARSRGAARLVLGMNKDNARALGFYQRHGFIIIGEREFVVGDTVCSDFVLALEM